MTGTYGRRWVAVLAHRQWYATHIMGDTLLRNLSIDAWNQRGRTAYVIARPAEEPQTELDTLRASTTQQAE
ncbi:hypothetical protein ACFLT5_00010 [Chloroflexota bacterium]